MTAVAEEPTRPAVAEDADVFLSYSRRDQQFVLRIASALEGADWRVWVDTQDIPPASAWRDELGEGIRAAHTFVFAVSPDSVASDVCLWELKEASALGKRLIPLVIRDAGEVPPELAARQYLFMRETDDFGKALETLDSALRTDLEWVKEHRHWLMEALRWEAQDRDRSLLIRGRDLKAAEGWLARQGERTEPRPTPLHSEFLLASRAWETRRTQIAAAAVAVALAVSIALGVLALFQRNEARNQAAIARSRELSLASGAQLPVDPMRALLLATEAVKVRTTPEADNALRRAVFATRLRAEVALDVERVGGLVDSAAFSPDGKLVAAGLKNGTVAVVSSTARPQAQPTVLPAAEPAVENFCSTLAGSNQVALAFAEGTGAVAAVNDMGWINVWRWPNPGRPVAPRFCTGRTTEPEPTDLLTVLSDTDISPVALTFTSQNDVAVVQRDGRVVRWPWETRGKPVVVGRSRDGVLAGAISADGRTIALADDSALTVTPAAGGASRRLAVGDLLEVAMSADGGTVAGAAGRTLVVWRPRLAGRPVVLGTPRTIRSLATSRDGTLVAAGDDGHVLRVWDLSRGRDPVALTGSQGSVTALAFARDGERLVSGADDGRIRVWEWDPSRPPSVPRPAPRASTFHLTRDGRVAGVDPRDERRLWIDVGGRVRALDDVRSPNEVSVSRDGRRAVAPVKPYDSGSFQLWDLDRDARPRTVAATSRLDDAVLSPDGRWIALGARGFRVAPWPGRDARLLGPVGRIRYNTSVFAPNSRRVAAAAYDGKSSTISVWDVPAAGFRRGTRPAPLFTFDALGFVATLAFDRDGERLVSAHSDGAVRVWPLERDATPTVLRGHSGAVNSVAFSPDGAELVTGGGDSTLRVWRLDEGGSSVEIPGLSGPLVSVAFASDGSETIAVGTRGSRVWPCDFCGTTKAVLATAERLATRTLTDDERRLFLHEE